MIAATINQPFTAVLDGADTGRAAHLTVEVYDGVTDTLVLAADGTGVTEDPDSPGRYIVTRSVAVVSEPDAPFELRWREDGEIAGLEDIEVLPEAIPTVDELGTRMYARTLTDDGDYVGTFNETTKPTATQAQVLISDAASMVYAAIGDRDGIPRDLWPIRKYAIICRAAMSVERGYYPSHHDDNTDDTYRSWLGEYNAAVAALTAGALTGAPNIRLV